MTNIPNSVEIVLKNLRLIDSEPYQFTCHKIEFCKKLYSEGYRELSKWDIYNVMDKYPQLIDYTYLTEVQFDFIQEQYTFALESL